MPNSRTEPKQERARRTRGQILAVAAELFAQRGYATVTLQDVAERASMTKGAVYFHYKNKEDLAVAVVREHYGRWPGILEKVSLRELPAFEALVEVLAQVSRTFHEDVMVQAGARLQIERSLIEADLPEPYVGWEDYLTELVEAVEKAGELREGITPRAAARIIVATFFGMQHISDVLTRRADLAERQAELHTVLLDGLRRP
ncbi:TetR family transcriptional regulator [Streptomyces sp. SID5785]|uniref:ScbR family autoregulator-binding transcription factor n=1 Tax=Streptomyces sp. SID5785 TaxID=2690309 RepID=UPI001361CFA9|nr:ScbR family autoregulator-binding transcription factor [Streptomyces sp. SID5785]MZD07184.1 TetR family transcriptional regulator [Streptomyces sp. SID5785]